MGFSRQEYWSGLPFPSPGDLPPPRDGLASPALAGTFFTTEPPGMLPNKISHDVTQRLEPIKVYRGGLPLCRIHLLCTPKLVTSYLSVYMYMNLKFDEKRPLSASHWARDFICFSIQFLEQRILSADEWLELWASNARDSGVIPGQGTRIPQVPQPPSKKIITIPWGPIYKWENQSSEN